MDSTMQDVPLTIGQIFRHGQSVFGSSEVLTYAGDHTRRATFTEVAGRVARLARGLRRLGVREGDRVGTFCWNHQEHLEAYLAIPSMGAVVHTLNIRLFPEQLAYIVRHGGDKVVLFDASLTGLLARVREALDGVDHLVAIGDGDTSALGEVLAYEELLAGEEPSYDWPLVDERDAAAMCYTSGTTGDPKGVVYSHRSTVLHSMAVTSANGLGLGQLDRVLPIVPMFHVNAWGVPYAAWMSGADILMPQRFLQAAPLAAMFAEHRPTLAAGVPTIWNDLLHFAEDNDVDLSSARALVAGGAAVPRALIAGYKDRFGIPLTQGWGMTETSPLCALAIPPRNSAPDDEIDYRSRTGRVIAGVEVRVVGADGNVLANDGASVGEFEVRGPWITGSYFGQEDQGRFHDGWLRTGDVGTLDGLGFMQITDRTKDVIKSGGEWISSVELENAIVAHPSVLEAAVIGVPDPKWDERPLACVVVRDDTDADVGALSAFLESKVARWWLPEQWAVVKEIPKTSVGKADKKVLRSLYAKGELDVDVVDRG